MSFREHSKNKPNYLPRVEKPQWVQVIRDVKTDHILTEYFPGKHLCPMEVKEKYPGGRVSMRRADGVNPFPNHRD